MRSRRPESSRQKDNGRENDWQHDPLLVHGTPEGRIRSALLPFYPLPTAVLPSSYRRPTTVLLESCFAVAAENIGNCPKKTRDSSDAEAGRKRNHDVMHQYPPPPAPLPIGEGSNLHLSTRASARRRPRSPGVRSGRKKRCRERTQRTQRPLHAPGPTGRRVARKLNWLVSQRWIARPFAEN